MIIDGRNYCPGCMKMKTGNAVCECGFNEETYEKQPHHLAPGTVLSGSIIIGKVIGEGGFGITYLGYDPDLDITVAVKEFYIRKYAGRNTESSNQIVSLTENKKASFEKGRDRFIEEARKLAKFLNEDGIVSIYRYFRENNTAYIVMEYIDGINLKDYLKQNGTMSFDAAAKILRPVMESLGRLHEENIIHRDISPDNIMIDSTGRAKLLDMGAARENSEDAKFSVILKMGYTPPEQYRTTGKQGPWTDVYALCATMYTCVTGFVPENSIDRELTDETVFWDKLKKNCPKEDELEIIKKGMQLDFNDRFKSMKELMTAIDGEEKKEKPQPGIKKWLVPAGIICACLFVVVGGYFLKHRKDAANGGVTGSGVTGSGITGTGSGITGAGVETSGATSGVLEESVPARSYANGELDEEISIAGASGPLAERPGVTISPEGYITYDSDIAVDDIYEQYSKGKSEVFENNEKAFVEFNENTTDDDKRTVLSAIETRIKLLVGEDNYRIYSDGDCFAYTINVDALPQTDIRDFLSYQVYGAHSMFLNNDKYHYFQIDRSRITAIEKKNGRISGYTPSSDEFKNTTYDYIEFEFEDEYASEMKKIIESWTFEPGILLNHAAGLDYDPLTEGIFDSFETLIAQNNITADDYATEANPRIDFDYDSHAKDKTGRTKTAGYNNVYFTDDYRKVDVICSQNYKEQIDVQIYNLVGPDLPDCFNFDINWPVIWESEESLEQVSELNMGKNQVDEGYFVESEIPAADTLIRMSYGSLGELYDEQSILKNCLDSCDIPYSIGYLSGGDEEDDFGKSSRMLVMRIPIQYAGKSFDRALNSSSISIYPYSKLSMNGIHTDNYLYVSGDQLPSSLTYENGKVVLKIEPPDKDKYSYASYKEFINEVTDKNHNYRVAMYLAYSNGSEYMFGEYKPKDNSFVFDRCTLTADGSIPDNMKVLVKLISAKITDYSENFYSYDREIVINSPSELGADYKYGFSNEVYDVVCANVSEKISNALGYKPEITFDENGYGYSHVYLRQTTSDALGRNLYNIIKTINNSGVYDDEDIYSFNGTLYLEFFDDDNVRPFVITLYKKDKLYMEVSFKYRDIIYAYNGENGELYEKQIKQLFELLNNDKRFDKAVVTARVLF